MPAVVGMPAHYEMLVSHSPPIYSHSPPNGYLSDYNSNTLYDPTRQSYSNSCRPQMLSQLQSRKSFPPQLSSVIQPQKKQLSSPKRSCLVVKSESESEDHPDVHEQRRVKKKVVFADDQGRSLTEVRIMSEPSNVPPVWSLKFLAHVTQGLISPVPPEQWTITFRQPASDYLEFKKKLDRNNVSLENVIVKENESIVVGTVKVKNISFHKEVFVRTSSDDWQSQEDTFCTYSQVGLASGTYVLYDTFSFKLTLPPVNRKLQFCICFSCDGKEYWDNNDNKNYTIFKRTMNYTDPSEILKKLDNCKIENAKTASSNNSCNGSDSIRSIDSSEIQKFADIADAKVPQWSEFASWTHLENSTPYCFRRNNWKKNAHTLLSKIEVDSS